MRKIKYSSWDDGKPPCRARPQKIFDNFYKDIFEGALEEKLAVFWIYEANVIGHEVIAIGTDKTTVSSMKQIFRGAIHLDADGIILAHNHPNGSMEFSEDDLQMTSEVAKAGKALGFMVYDHLLFGDGKVLSMQSIRREKKLRKVVNRMKSFFNDK